jgi:hypothetical protein
MNYFDNVVKMHKIEAATPVEALFNLLIPMGFEFAPTMTVEEIAEDCFNCDMAVGIIEIG